MLQTIDSSTVIFAINEGGHGGLDDKPLEHIPYISNYANLAVPASAAADKLEEIQSHQFNP